MVLILKYRQLKKQKEIVEYCDRMSNMIKNNENVIEENKKLMKKLLDHYIAKCESADNEEITTKVVRKNISLKAIKPIKKASDEVVKVSTSKKTAKVRKL